MSEQYYLRLLKPGTITIEAVPPAVLYDAITRKAVAGETFDLWRGRQVLLVCYPLNKGGSGEKSS